MIENGHPNGCKLCTSCLQLAALFVPMQVALSLSLSLCSQGPLNGKEGRGRPPRIVLLFVHWPLLLSLSTCHVMGEREREREREKMKLRLNGRMSGTGTECICTNGHFELTGAVILRSVSLD